MKAGSARDGRKIGATVAIVSLLEQPAGTTLDAMKAATGWKAHSVRGFISSVIRKKKGLTVTCTPHAGGERIYRIEK